MNTHNRGPGPLKLLAIGIRWREFLILILRRTKKNVCVPMADGANLRVDIFRPGGKGPWPVIVSAYPYHKDGLGATFSLEAYYFVKAGYAVVLADIRGTGASDGISRDPFDGLRAADMYALVEWSAKQDWSTGNVGMSGMSYGGVTALAGASARPPSLKAIFAGMAPISFYEDIAFPGGSLNMLSALGSWVNLMNLLSFLPPLCTKSRSDWRKTWQNRLKVGIPILFNPSENVTQNKYWKDLEIPVENIAVPTLILEGWRGFSYRNAFRLYERLRSSKKMIIGPWVHIRPNMTQVEPIDYMKEIVGWFDRWLKGRNDTGEEPPLSIYVMGEQRWKYEQHVLPREATERILYVQAGGSLGPEADLKPSDVRYAHDPGVGTAAGLMSLFSLGMDYPRDQREDNERSLCFDTMPLSEAMEIVGEPLLRITVATDMPDAAIAAKLCDVGPDGYSAHVTHGWLRLSRRNGLEHPQPPEPHREYEVLLRLWPIDYKLPPGHCLRLTVALSDFPHIFPLPYKGEVRLYFGQEQEAKLTLMIMPASQERQTPHFDPPDMSLLAALKTPGAVWEVSHDRAVNATNVHAGLEMRLPLPHPRSPLTIQHYFDAHLMEGRPETASLDARASADFRLDGHVYHAEAKQTVDHEHAEVSIKIDEDGKEAYSRVVSGQLKWV